MRKLEKTVVLVGMMGAGKSSVGRRLAQALGVPFRDADSEIEAAAGCSVSEIFSRYGEAAFRDGERKVVARLLAGPPHVLATGGGAFADDQTRTRIKKDAVSVWLKADIDLLLERTGRKDSRPLLRSGDPRATLEKLMTERATIYGEADIIVESGAGPHGEVVRRILAALDARRPESAA
jgi:shikimate kinase